MSTACVKIIPARDNLMPEFHPLFSLLFWAVDAHTQLLFTLFVMFVAAKLLALTFLMGCAVPAVAGEILAGVGRIGPSVLNWVQPSEMTATLSEIGVIFLLFLCRPRNKPADICVGLRASLVAVLGVIFPFIAGYALCYWWGQKVANIEAIFLSARQWSQPRLRTGARAGADANAKCRDEPHYSGRGGD
ncbi:MAG: cation:proton antiporter [Blastocatellia bacterium]